MRMNGKQRRQGDIRRGSMWASLLYHHENTASSKSLGIRQDPPQPGGEASIKLEKCFPRGQSSGHGGVAFSPALAAEPDLMRGGAEGETLHTTVASGKEGGETKSSIMDLFDANRRPTAPVAEAPRPPRIGATGHAWASSTRTVPLSMTTGKDIGSGSAFATGSGGGAERYGYLSFSEVQVDDTEHEEVLELGSWGSYGSAAGSSLRDSGRFSRSMLQKRLKKRARAWRVFLAVMQEHGLRVRKYHRRGKGWAHRVVKYDPSLPGLRWKTHKWWDSGGGQLPLRDVLDVERRGRVVWVKCLHLGTVGFEASLETDAVIFYLAMDSLLDKRCGVFDGRGPRMSGVGSA